MSNNSNKGFLGILIVGLVGGVLYLMYINKRKKAIECLEKIKKQLLKIKEHEIYKDLTVVDKNLIEEILGLIEQVKLSNVIPKIKAFKYDLILKNEELQNFIDKIDHQIELLDNNFAVDVDDIIEKTKEILPKIIDTIKKSGLFNSTEFA